jgi:regulator of sigma E protease
MSALPNYLFAVILLLSILVFVHELGHFLVAKACGVRVLKFSIGFGHPVGFGRHRLCWKRGDTEYVIAWFPLGGFVKMLGENPDERDDSEVLAHPDEALGAKPLWQKLAIVFAGPVMNLVLPIAIFAGMQAVGMPRPDAVIGLVESGSPAMAAGLEPGDRIVSIDGVAAEWWSDVDEAIHTGPGAELAIAYERDGQGLETVLRVGERSGFDAFGAAQQVGWAGLGHARPRAVLGIPGADSAAQGAGLRSGDVVTTVEGEPVEDWYGFVEAYAAAGATGTVTIQVQRGEETPTLEAPAVGDAGALGVVRANVLVAEVEVDSPAQRAGLRSDDLILEFDGRPVTSFFSFAQRVRTGEGHPIRLVYARDGERHEVTLAPELIPTDTGFGIEEERYRIGIRGSEALLPGSAALDRERNPLVSVPRAVDMTVDVTRVFLVGLGKIVTGEVSRRQVAGPIGIAQIAGSALQQGWETYLRILVLISINLGILNLLPIPILDGGQALLFLVEGVKRSPLSLRTRLAVQQIGLTVLVLLMGMAFWNDLSRLWSKFAGWLPNG